MLLLLLPAQNAVASKGRGILAMDESNATCGKRLESIGLENTETNRQAYRELLVTTPGLGQYISGAIMFEETLFQSTSTGKKMVDCLKEQGIVPGEDAAAKGASPHCVLLTAASTAAPLHWWDGRALDRHHTASESTAAVPHS